MPEPKRFPLDLIRSVCTKSIDEEIHPFDDPEALHLQNTGIERNGGISSIYEVEAAHPAAGQYFVTKRNKLLSREGSSATRQIKIDGRTIGEVSELGIEARRVFSGIDDAIVSAEIGKVVTAKLSGTTITVSNVDIATGAIIASRSTSFAALTGVTGYTSLSIIRKKTVEYSDSLEFVVRAGDKVYLLRESDASFASSKFSNVTKFNISRLTACGPYTVFTGPGGKVFSVDSAGRYRYPDGTGTGTGPFDNGDALGGQEITVTATVGSFFVIGASSRMASWDGTNWKRYDGSGTGTGPWLSNTTTVLGGVQLLAAIAYGSVLVISGQSGYVASYDGTNWKNYDGTGTGTGPCDNGTAIGAANAGTLAVSGSILVVASSSGSVGRLGNWNGSAWTTYLGGGAAAQPYNNGSVVGANNIVSMVYLGSILLVAGSGGQIGNWNGASWTTYTGGGGANQPYNNAVVIGALSPWLTVYGTTVLVVGAGSPATGRLGSWDGSNWKNYDGTGTGTGLYKNAEKAFDYGSASMAVVNTHVFFAGNGSAVFVYNTVSAAWETVHSGLHVPASHFGFVGVSNNYLRTLVFKDLTGKPLYFIVSHGYNISSFDGVAWKYWDGTGSGTGPYNSNSVVGSFTISALGQYNTFLIVGSANGRIGSWDGANWKTYAGVGTGTGPYDNSTVIGGEDVQSILQYSATILVISGGVSAGRVGNWNGSAWTTYTGGGAAAQPYNNSTAIGAVGALAACLYKTFFVLIGSSGRIGSWDGANWKNYDGTGTGTGPYNNNTATATAQWSGIQYGNYLVIGAGGGRVASWDGSNWKNYDGTGTGTGPYNNGTAVPSGEIIYSFQQVGKHLYAFSAQGRMGGYDGTAWRNHDGTGTGSSAFHGYSGIVGGAGLFTSARWNGAVVFLPAAGCTMISVFQAETCWHVQAMESRVLRIIEAGAGQVFAYKFENDNYLIGVTANAENIFYLVSTAWAVQSVAAKYVVMQDNGTYSRALLYRDPSWHDLELDAVGIVGYAALTSTFTNIVQYPPFSERIEAATVSLAGPGSIDMTYTKVDVANQIWAVHSPGFISAETSLLTVRQAGTNTAVGAYGKLTNGLDGKPSGSTVEFRLLWIGGSATTLSVALIDPPDDVLGVLLSAVGEVYEGHTIHVSGNTVLYRAAGRYTVVKIGTSPLPVFQKIDDDLYKVNTIHPVNLYDELSESMNVSSCDYNGRAFFYNTATPSVTSKKFAAVVYTPLTSGIDVGDRLVQHTILDYAAYTIIGNRIPALTVVFPNYGVDVYVEDIYYRTTLSSGSELADPLKADSLYLTSTDLPIPLGWIYGDRVATGLTATVFPSDSRDVYAFGNEVLGEQIGFQLFGQRYLFDGISIWLAAFDGSTFTRRERVASATGLLYVGVSPVTAFFISSFDNSLFAFDGGRTLQKAQRLNNETAITRGIWSTRDNALLLESSDRFLWIRDSIITRNYKKATQTSLQLADTIVGAVLWNDTYRWRYPYIYEAGALPVPLTWQSAYYGTPGNQKTVFSEWIVTLFNEAKTLTAVMFTCRAFDLENITTETRRVTVNPTDWTGVGFTRLRVRPPAAKCLAQSIQLDTTSHVLIADVVAEITEEAKGLTPSARSA